MSITTTINLAAALFTALATSAFDSSHREALAVLNEPCTDNTDTYAWISNGAHAKPQNFFTFTQRLIRSGSFCRVDLVGELHSVYNAIFQTGARFNVL